jgi:glycosyltransferase involved in cell wall biosynthesis
MKLARQGKDALLTKPGDLNSLSDALRSVLFTDNVATTFSNSGRERAEQFSMDELAMQYQKIYERALTISPAAPLLKRGRYFNSSLSMSRTNKSK